MKFSLYYAIELPILLTLAAYLSKIEIRLEEIFTIKLSILSIFLPALIIFAVSYLRLHQLKDNELLNRIQAKYLLILASVKRKKEVMEKSIE